MGLVRYLFDGRLNRKEFWLALIGIVIVGAAIDLGVSLLGGTPPAATPSPDFTIAAGFTISIGTEISWAVVVRSLILVLPCLIAGVRRRRDRNASGLDVVLYAALTIALQVGQALGYGATTAGFVLFLLVVVWGLYLFVLLAFLPGTRGDNRYGPEPVSREVLG